MNEALKYFLVGVIALAICLGAVMFGYMLATDGRQTAIAALVVGFAVGAGGVVVAIVKDEL